MAEAQNISDDEILSAFKGEQQKASQPVYQKEEAKGISDEEMLSAFKGTTPKMQTSGGTLSGGGELFRPEMVGSTVPQEQSSLIGSGALGSGQFAPIPAGPKGKFDNYAGITDPDTRKGIAETVFKGITNPHDLEELHKTVPWYNMAESPVQMESLFQYKWNKETNVFDLITDFGKAGVGMLASLPPLVVGAGRLAKDAFTGAVYVGTPEDFGKGKTLTEEQKKGLNEQQIRDAELSLRDKTYRSARVFGDALLMAREDLLKATKDFSEGKAMLWDKAKVGLAKATAGGTLGDPSIAPAISAEEEAALREAAAVPAMEQAKKNFATRMNAKYIDHMQREKNPAVLARTINDLWQDPAVKKYWVDVVEKLMPPAEDAVFGFGGNIEAAKANRRLQAEAAAEAGVQAQIQEANRLREDPEQVGAVAMTTPLNVFGLAGGVAGELSALGQQIGRGLRAAGMSTEARNAMYAADSAALQAQRAAEAIAREQPGFLEKPLGNIADAIDRSKTAFESLPKPVKYAGSTLLGAGAGALASDDPLAGALKGAGTGLGIHLVGKAIAAAPRLGQQLLKAGRLSGAELGRFEALEKMESASPEVQRFLNWSQKAGGGKALDFIEKNANVFVQHNISMLPMMVALGVLEDKDAQELAQMWAEFATYGFIHGQVLGGLLGNDPIRNKMNRDAEMRQAQRVMLGFSPESRENVTNANWDKVIQQSKKRLDRTQKAYFAEMVQGANRPETQKAKEDYEFAYRLHQENIFAPPEARQAFEDGIKLSLGKVSNLINGVLTPNSNMNIELLTSSQIIDKMIAANPNFNGVGSPMTVEQALKKNPTANGIFINKGTAKDGFTMDPAKDTVFVNITNALKKAELSGQAISNVLAHEVAGHGLFGNEQYRHKIAPLFNMMFGTEAQDENGNWHQVTPAQPGMSRDDLYKKFFKKYLEGKSSEEVADYAEAAGLLNSEGNDFNKDKIVQLMREEALAEAHAGRFFGDPESPAQSGLSWLASRVSSQNVKSALNYLYAIAGPAVYKQWASGLVGVTYSPDVMRAIRNVEREMQKYDGDFTDAERNGPIAAPITPKDVKKSKELLNKYFKDTGKFETTPVAVVTDANGKVVQTVKLKDNDASEGSWIYHQDDTTGDNVPNKERGFGELHPELVGLEVPVGGRVQVERQIAYDEATGKPKERKNKETVEHIKRRVQLVRDAIDNAGDPSQLGRFRAVGGKEGDEDLHYTGKMTPEQRAAIEALPESVVPASMKELLLKYDDLMTRGDGTVLDIDYASRLNDKGNYQAFSPKIRQIVPLQLHLSKAGNFYTTAWDISDLRRKVRLYEKYAKGVFEPWGGDTQKFWNEFRTVLLPNLANPDASVPGWQGLDADPNVAKLKRTIYEKMLGAPNPNVPGVEAIPDLSREKFSRSEKKLDKQSSFDQIIKSFRLDSHTAAEENANTEYKYPIPYKARFMPEQEATQEEQRPALGGGILKGLQAVSAKYNSAGTGEIKVTVQPAAGIVLPAAPTTETLRTSIDQIYDTTATTAPAGDRGRGRAPREYTPLKGAPIVEGATGPDPRLNAVFEQYARSKGIPVRRQAEYVTVDPERAKRIADAYEAMPHAPNDPAVREAYSDLIRQTRDQHDALMDAGYKFWFIDPENDPYAGKPWNAMRDLRKNQSMGVFPTEAGFGSGETEFNVADNPLLADTGLMWPYGSPDGPLKRVTANDLFRAVHDAFGHGLEGAGFRADGEENAWQAHSRLFTGPALGALTSETRGQNSWLNYGPHGEKNKTASVFDTIFADQKTGLMPEWTWSEGVARDEVYPEGAQVRFMPERIDAEHAAAHEARDEGKAREMVRKAAEAAGYTRNAKHGTTHNFTVFNLSRANAENDMGKGFYFSTSPSDVEANYAGKGPDLATRIEQLTEKIYDQMDDSELKSFPSNDVAYEAAKFEAEKQLVGGGQRVIDAYINLKNPFIIGGKNETTLEENQDLHSKYPSGWAGSLFGSLESAGDYYNSFYGAKGSISKISEEAYDGGIRAKDIVRIIKDQFSDATDPESGEFAGNQVVREVIEDLGFDGIVDNTVNDKFGKGKKYGKPMVGIDESTQHIIAFNPESIKSADPFTYDNAGKLIPLSERFNPASSDIRFMPSREEVDAAAEARGYKKVVRSFPKAEYKSPIKEGDWVSADNQTGRDYQDEYAGAGWDRPEVTERAYVSKGSLEDMQTGGGPDQTLVVKPGASVKSADMVTYDDAGNEIPLSKRFNPALSDIRFMPEREEEPEKTKQRSALRVRMTREALTEAALSQASWKDWYSEHQETLDDFFGDKAPLFQNILAITSQAASVKANVGLALKAFGQLMRGEEFTGYLPAVAGNLGKLRDAAGPNGQKIQAYKAANEGDTSSVVVDRHIARMLFGVDTPTPKQFAKAAKVLTQIADKIGWTPAQVQAALWAHSIVQSGKQPESYGNYLKRLESQGGITKRIGAISDRGAGTDVVGGPRGRYSPNDEGSLSRVTPIGEEGAETRFMPLSSAAQAELSPEEKKKYTNFKKGTWTEVQDAPSITMHDLIGKKVFPSFADLTSGGRIYKGIDSSEIAIPIQTHGGPEWPLIQPEKVGEETNVWSNQGAGVSATKAKRANEGAIMLVTTMDKDAHISNTEIANAIISTNVAYARDKRIKPDQANALDNRIREEMPDFPGIQSSEINDYVKKLPFQGDNSRARLANVLSQKDAEELGAANVQRILDEMRAPSYEGSRAGEAVMAIELTPGAPVIKLGEQGTMTHPSYQYAVRGKVIGRLDRPVHWEMIYDDFLNARRAEGKPKEGDRRAIDLAKPLQLITQEIADRIPQTKYQNIKSARHAQVLMKAVNGEWRSSAGKIKDGAVSPADFINTLNGNDAKIALDKYTLPEIKEKIKKGTITLHQLGDSQVYFATKPGDPATGYGKDPKEFGFGDNEKTLSLVLNGERGTAGMGDAIVMKALQEGVTALDCFAVKSSKYPDGMLPALYGRFGFETVGEIPFDPSYYSTLELNDLKRFWKKNGWQESTGYPPVVLMKWTGNDNQRQSTLLDLVGQASAGIRERAEGLKRDAMGSGIGSTGGQDESTQGGLVKGDASGSGGSQGAALQGIQLSRGTVGAVQELFKMTAAELQNLGVNPESVNKAKK